MRLKKSKKFLLESIILGTLLAPTSSFPQGNYTALQMLARDVVRKLGSINPNRKINGLELISWNRFDEFSYNGRGYYEQTTFTLDIKGLKATIVWSDFNEGEYKNYYEKDSLTIFAEYSSGKKGKIIDLNIDGRFNQPEEIEGCKIFYKEKEYTPESDYEKVSSFYNGVLRKIKNFLGSRIIS